MAQHTSRQRTHLITCQAYLDAMRSQGIENSITRRAADPSTFAKPPRIDQPDGAKKRKAVQKIMDFPAAIRIQALALAEASISYDRIREITGIEPKLVDKLRKIARDRGYDPTTSMQIKEEYVVGPVNKAQDRPKKQRYYASLQNAGGCPADGAILGYIRADSATLPPGNWNIMAATPVPSDASLR